MPQGGAREGAGRPAMDGSRITSKLTPKQIAYLDKMIKTGQYATRSEAIRACIESWRTRKGVRNDFPRITK